MFSMTKIQLDSVIKGYHVYKVKPSIGTICSVSEDDNSVLISDKTVGHVPAKPFNVNEAFKEIRDISASIEIKW